MTEAEKELAAVVKWLRGGGLHRPEDWEGSGFRPKMKTRFYFAWLTFRCPWGFARLGQQFAADAIERGDHRKGEQ